MSGTKHLNQKISQSDLYQSLASWIDENCEGSDVDHLLVKLKYLKRKVAEMYEKGGYVMVSISDADITIYQIRK